ncbi:conserved hypothetical protein [Methylobacterium sp. 4-46]|nr:conserved hypothetical protein [Methylobacterium sp. 4-46]
MSAASPKTQEPSMEEILASIRRIIADDQKEAEMANLAAARPAPVPEPEDEEDILDLAGVAEPVRKPPLEDEPEIAFKDEPDFDAIEIEPPAPPPPPAPPKAAAPPRPEPAPIPAPAPEPAPERLISKDTDASVSQAFHLLAHTVLTNNARTLEDLVQDMLRPMLKAWLDDNLPAMVERLVRAEIERVARGR